jgi:DNA-binding NtrC family response regulator
VRAEQRIQTQPKVGGEVIILCGEEEVRDVLAYWFMSLTPTIVAEDGHRANRILQQRSCSLLITDRVLPPWPGLDTLRMLRDANPRLRIVFVDNGNIHDRALAGIVGATDYLARPLDRRAAVEVLQRAEAAIW